MVFEERGKPEYPEKTSRYRVEDQHTQPTYDAESRNQTRATLVGGECSHHCAIPAPLREYVSYNIGQIKWKIETTTPPKISDGKMALYGLRAASSLI